MVKESEPRLLAEAAALGVVGALAAQLFTWVLHLCSRFFLTWMAGYHPPGLPAEGGVLQEAIGPHGYWLIPLATTLGGLLSGFLVYTWAPEAEGHGTDSVVKAFHRAGGFIRSRVAPLKLVASAITIGSGGSAGREGPTALIGAGTASIYANLAHRPDEKRQILILAGMAAGLSAIFRSPIGAAFFAIEVLYSSIEFEAEALLYTMLASVIAYAINGWFVGWKPLFYFPSFQNHVSALEYGWFGILGVTGGLVATLIPTCFYRARDAFRALPIPQMLHPAIGGLGVGLLALEFPQVLGGGYGWIQEAIDGRVVLKLLFILLFLKIIAFAFTVSSGGSGGIFAPTLFVGAMLGGTLASLSHLPTAMFVVMGMAATFAGAAHVPIASLMMVTEMTGSYRLLPPAAFAVLLSYLVQSQLSAHLKYNSLYEAQVPGLAQSPLHSIENVQIALKLLDSHEVPRAAKIGHLGLVSLLDSGIPVTLAGRKQLALAILKPEKSLVGKTVQDCYTELGNDTLEIFAILRDGEVLFPSPTTAFQENDRVLVIGSPKARDRILAYFSPTPATGADQPSGSAGSSV